MPVCFDLNTDRPLLPPTFDFVNSRLSNNLSQIKGLQLYYNILLQNSNIHKTCQTAFLALYFQSTRLKPSVYAEHIVLFGYVKHSLQNNAKISLLNRGYDIIPHALHKQCEKCTQVLLSLWL